MKKKSIILIIATLLLIAAVAYIWLRLTNRWTDINGVTTVYERNTVYMNAKPDEDFYSGGIGELTVSGDRHIHVEYSFDTGSFDVAFQIYVKGSKNLDMLSSVFDNLPNSGDVFGKSSVSGKGILDLEAAPGTYVVYFKSHGAVGSAIVTAEKK